MKKIFTIAASALALYVNAQTAPTWTEQNSNFPVTGTYPSVLSARGDNVVWGIGADGTGGGASYKVYTKTSNGGATWTAGQMSGVPAGVEVMDIAAGDANTAWISAYDAGSAGVQGVWKTTNGGSSWTRQASAAYNDADSFANIVYFWDLNTGIAIGDPVNGRFQTYTTTDGGTTWTAVTGAVAESGEYGYVHNKAVAGNTIWAGTNHGRIYRSNDKGATWLATISSPLSDFGGSGESGEIVLKDANTAWILSILGVLYKTTDAGASFDPIDTESGTLYPLSIAYIPGTEQTLLSGGASSTYGRGSSISFDGGANWIEIVNDSEETGITAFAANSTSGIYGGSFNNGATGGMFKLTGVLATSDINAKKGISISPNPTYGDLNISTVLNVKSVEVVDMNGRIIKTFGADSKKLDLSSLQAGVYAVKVNTADGKSQITKFIKK